MQSARWLLLFGPPSSAGMSDACRPSSVQSGGSCPCFLHSEADACTLTLLHSSPLCLLFRNALHHFLPPLPPVFSSPSSSSLQAVALSVEQSKQALPMDEAALITYDNMIKLNDLNEPTILHNLRQRFLGDKIYTYVSSILVACNPFKLLPIYTPEIMDKYKDGGGREQPPHIYAISDNAYRNLMESFRDQAVSACRRGGGGRG